MNDVDHELVAMTLKKVKEKLDKARSDGPFGPPVELEPSEAMLVWRLLFGGR